MFRATITITVAVLAAGFGNAQAMTVEFAKETCTGISELYAEGNVCVATNLRTLQTQYVVTVGVGAFADTKVLGAGVSGRSAIVATVTFDSGEAKSAEDARNKAIGAFKKAKAVQPYEAAPMCSAPTESAAATFLKELAAATRVQENQCHP